VIGYRLKGYERYLVQQNRDRWQGRFRIFAFIPTLITRNEETELRNSGVHIRVSIESSPMGLYKSLAFEIFKRRTSVLLALDGNSAGANMIQEARNAKYECRIYVSMHSRSLKTKAESLEGYVTLFADEKEVLPRILRDIGHLGL
ncbi:MAG TPA: adenosine deaminase, partial [Lachnospiraceae bacterium]|nr:adenosine deaminase [Lachnospiraceae bacterium]